MHVMLWLTSKQSSMNFAIYNHFIDLLCNYLPNEIQKILVVTGPTNLDQLGPLKPWLGGAHFSYRLHHFVKFQMQQVHGQIGARF